MSISVSGLGAVQSFYPAPVEAVPPVPAIAPVGHSASSSTDYKPDADAGAYYQPGDPDRHAGKGEALTYAAPQAAVSELGASAVVAATDHVDESDVRIAVAAPAVSAPAAPLAHAAPQSPALPASSPALGDHDARTAEAVASAAYALVADASGEDQPSEVDFPKFG